MTITMAVWVSAWVSVWVWGLWQYEFGQ